MKRKFSLSAVLLFITVLLLIAGIFFIGIQTRGQLLDTRKQFETFVSQINKEQYTLTEAQASFDTAIQSKKDLLNYYEKNPHQSSLLFRSIWIPTNHLPMFRLLYSVR